MGSFQTKEFVEGKEVPRELIEVFYRWENTTTREYAVNNYIPKRGAKKSMAALKKEIANIREAMDWAAYAALGDDLALMKYILEERLDLIKDRKAFLCALVEGMDGFRVKKPGKYTLLEIAILSKSENVVAYINEVNKCGTI